jgi:catechol 2,3-dioxygenase-like lactoylglutathione lyase family enzyme
LAIGALASGALALGALAIGSIAVGALAVGRARIRRLAIDELDVKRLRVKEPEMAGAMTPQPMIAVHDVEASSAWYRAVLGVESGHGGPEYERLVSEGRLVMQIHRWDVHEHPRLGDPEGKPHGNGVLLWFQTDDFDAALRRIESAGAEVLEGPLVNRSARHREIWLRDPDGYKVVIAGRYGDVGADAPQCEARR